MNVNEIDGIQAKHKALLAGAGLTTVAAVHAAGMAGLTAISGIGEKTATAILAALPVEGLTIVGSGDIRITENPDVIIHDVIISSGTAPISVADIPPVDSGNIASLSPLRWVIVRNDSPGPVIVGNTYLYPGEARKVRAAHAPAGLTIKEISDGN